MFLDCWSGGSNEIAMATGCSLAKTCVGSLIVTSGEMMGYDAVYDVAV